MYFYSTGITFSDKGVKVELGIPYELWDKPSAEITNMKTQVILLEYQLQHWVNFDKLLLF